VCIVVCIVVYMVVVGGGLRTIVFVENRGVHGDGIVSGKARKIELDNW
jgi:hypothetical protein